MSCPTQHAYFRTSLTPTELEFARAAASPILRLLNKDLIVDRWAGVCDTHRMVALADKEPALLQSVGPTLLCSTIALKGCAPATNFLLQRGVPLSVEETAYNCLHKAGWAGCTDNLRHVFEAGFDATIVGLIKPHGGWPDNYSLMYWAAWGGYVDMAKLLIKHGARVNHELPLKGNGSRGTTSLHEAVANGPWSGDFTLKSKKGKLEPGPWVSSDDTFRSNEGKLEVARLLIEDGAHYDIYSACGLNDTTRLGQLLSEDAESVNRRDAFLMTPLHWAARAGATECAAILLRHGAEIEDVDKSKTTPIHLATGAGKDEVIWLLAEHGANLDVQDASGRTPLHLATYNGRLNAAETLIVLGASTTVRMKSGKTPLQVARLACKHLKTA
jgi:ankyrin repeat protein